MKACACDAARLQQKLLARRALHQPAVVEKGHLVGEAARLSQVMRDQHDAARLSPRTSPTSASMATVAAGSRLEVGSSRIRISGSVASARAIDEQLLLAARQHPRRRLGQVRDVRPCQRRQGPFVPLGARHAGDGQRVGDVGQRRAPQQHRPLEHEADLGRPRAIRRRYRPS